MAYFDDYPKVDVPPINPPIIRECKECGEVVLHYFGKMPWRDDIDVLNCSVCGFLVQVDKESYRKSLEKGK